MYNTSTPKSTPVIYRTSSAFNNSVTSPVSVQSTVLLPYRIELLGVVVDEVLQLVGPHRSVPSERCDDVDDARRLRQCGYGKKRKGR